MLKLTLFFFFFGCFIFLPFQADLCVPRLNEGDQVVQINGRDISDHTHDQVVMFIKASCESHSGELILLVRPNGESCLSVTGLWHVVNVVNFKLENNLILHTNFN